MNWRLISDETAQLIVDNSPVLLIAILQRLPRKCWMRPVWDPGKLYGHEHVKEKCMHKVLADWKASKGRPRCKQKSNLPSNASSYSPVSHSPPTPTWTWKGRLRVRMDRAAWIHSRWDIQADLAWGHRRKEPINHMIRYSVVTLELQALDGTQY